MFLPVALWTLLVLVQGDYKYVYTVNLLPTNPGGAVRVGDAVTIEWSGKSPSPTASLQVQLSLIDMPRWTSLGSIAPPVAQSSRLFKWIVPALTQCPRLYQIYIADIASTYGYGYSSSFNVSCAPPPPPLPSPSPLCYQQLRNISVLKDNVPMSLFANLTRVQGFQYNNPTQVPSFVAVPRSVSDVQRVLACAAEAGIQVAIKGGGHSYAGFSQVAPHANDSFLLSFSGMKEVSLVKVLDANTSLVEVSAGALFQDVFDFINGTFEYDDLVIPGGLCPTVGVAGFMLGGGIGAISRTHGLGIDNIVSMKMVTADGSSVVTASSSQETDLYWALRGGGQANMGVVTSFVIQLKDGHENWTYGVHCIGDRTQMTASLNNFVNFVNRHSDFDRGLTVHWRVTTYNAALNKTVPSGLCYYVYSTLGVNATSSTLEDALSLSTTGGSWIVNLQKKDSFLKMEEHNAEVKRYDQFSNGPMVTRNCVVPSMSAALAMHILAMYDTIANQSAPCYVQGLAAGGQINAVQSNATAFPFRSGAAYYSDAECDYSESALTGPNMTTIVKSWMTRLLQSGLCQGSYQNFPFQEPDPNVGFDFKTFYWNDNLPRLQQQRLKWNPWINNTLLFAQQVPLPVVAVTSLPPELPIASVSRAAGRQSFHSLILSLAITLAMFT